MHLLGLAERKIKQQEVIIEKYENMNGKVEIIGNIPSKIESEIKIEKIEKNENNNKKIEPNAIKSKNVSLKVLQQHIKIGNLMEENQILIKEKEELRNELNLRKTENYEVIFFF